jgi:hypothetical protein
MSDFNPDDLSPKATQADYDATERDIQRLTAITENLREFIADSQGEDRSQFKTHLFLFDGLFRKAIIMSAKIAEKIHETTGMWP